MKQKYGGKKASTVTIVTEVIGHKKMPDFSGTQKNSGIYLIYFTITFWET
jgi:ribosomal protein S19